jgi:hypothetical protein
MIRFSTVDDPEVASTITTGAYAEKEKGPRRQAGPLQKESVAMASISSRWRLRHLTRTTRTPVDKSIAPVGRTAYPR